MLRNEHVEYTLFKRKIHKHIHLTITYDESIKTPLKRKKEKKKEKQCDNNVNNVSASRCFYSLKG